MCKLRQRAASCDFGESEVDDYFRDQLIDKCYSSNLRRKFLEQAGRRGDFGFSMKGWQGTRSGYSSVERDGSKVKLQSSERRWREKCCSREERRKCGKIGHFPFKCSQVHRLNGRGKFERKSGTGGSYRSGRERGTEANFAEGERFSAG